MRRRRRRRSGSFSAVPSLVSGQVLWRSSSTNRTTQRRHSPLNRPSITPPLHHLPIDQTTRAQHAILTSPVLEEGLTRIGISSSTSCTFPLPLKARRRLVDSHQLGLVAGSVWGLSEPKREQKTVGASGAGIEGRRVSCSKGLRPPLLTISREGVSSIALSRRRCSDWC